MAYDYRICWIKLKRQGMPFSLLHTDKNGVFTEAQELLGIQPGDILVTLDKDCRHKTFQERKKIIEKKMENQTLTIGWMKPSSENIFDYPKNRLPPPTIKNAWCHLCEELKPFSAISNFHKHLLEKHHPSNEQKKKKVAEKIKCKFCPFSESRIERVQNHPCVVMDKQLRTCKDLVFYKMQNEDDALVKMIRSHVELGHELEAINVCTEMKLCIPGLFPMLFVPEKWRGRNSVDFQQFGQTNPREFLKSALEKKYRMGMSNGLVVDKDIAVTDETCSVIMPLSKDVILTPEKDKDFKITDLKNGKVVISLHKPPKLSDIITKPQVLEANQTLTEFQKYVPERNKKCQFLPHRYPKYMVRGSTMFREVHKMPSEDLKRFTGMDEKTFWTHVERMKSNGLRPQKGGSLSIASLCLLQLMKIRKNYDMRTLAILFGVTKDVVYRLFWRTALKHYDIGNRVPKLWTKPGLTDDEMNNEFKRMKEEEDPFFTNLCSYIDDPKGQGRIPIGSRTL